MKTLLQTLVKEFEDLMAGFEQGVLREAVLPNIPHKINVALGMRRTGKTYFLLQKIQALLVDNVPLSQILYINFEDDRLYPLTQARFAELVDNFYLLNPQNSNKNCYFFFDEIQNIEGWQRVIRRLFDTKKIKLYLTGSSAKLLSKEIATSLRGRSISTEIWPFSFGEYTCARQPVKPLFHEYLMKGGFPEVTKLEDVDRNRILQDYVNVVIFRDIIERHHITNITLIKYMIQSLLKQTGSSFSINKFHNDLKSQGFSVGKNTIHEYLAYIEDAYLAFTVPLYTESVRKSQTNPKKIYAIDTGLVSAYTFSFSENIGRLFENAVFLELKRKGHNIYYYLTKNRYEVDFVTRDPEGSLNLYQVVWDTNNKETMMREERALKEAEKELNMKGHIITPENFVTFAR